MRAKQKNRLRKSTKYIYVLIAIALAIISLFNLLYNLSESNMKTKTKQVYQYTNKFNYDYYVNLIENQFMSNTQITDKTLAYVTDLIDTINLDFNYKYLADKESNLQYQYSIIGKMQVIYTKDGEEQKIWEEEEVLLKKENLEQQSNKIDIKENLKLDLKEKNELLYEFKQKMGMSIDAKYTVTLKVDITTQIEDKSIQVNYSPTIQVDLAEKTSKITGENNIEESQYISKEYQVNSSRNVFMIILDVILLFVAAIIVKYVTKSKTIHRVKNEYRQELNRILKLCQDKIVQVSTRPMDNLEDIVYVKDFGEIIKVSEELFKPILYYFDYEKEEAWFSVMSSGTVYRYILKK
ncbi:MAG: DUF5305 family protein [Clostridia bacterium]